jgi:hypothetical protein
MLLFARGWASNTLLGAPCPWAMTTQRSGAQRMSCGQAIRGRGQSRQGPYVDLSKEIGASA